MAAMKQFGGEKDEAPALDIDLGLTGTSSFEQRSFIGYLVGTGIGLAEAIRALEEDGDAASTKLAGILASARNNIDAAVFLLVAGEDA